MKKKSTKTNSSDPGSQLTAPNSAPSFTEVDALNIFAGHLDHLGWKYHRSPESNSLFSGFNGTDMLWDYNMVARDKGDGVFHLSVNSFIPNKVPPAQRLKLAETLTRINWQLSLGCFEMNFDDGEIRFRTGTNLTATDITPGVVDHLLRSNLAIVDERITQIMAALYSDVSPEDALKPKPKESDNQTRFDFN